ncbi:non-homologous end-joining DNA ligase [Pseudonocardia acaciae]|uniref:non-homologous end-joining DNA ligase n=1 Tax=Pseudonocardia acaciae TaxID=551276 RepID=UPI00048DB1F8|nr:non-homologous end-joining DNA ligase [Pseudonocardia acaciae]
MTVQVSRPDKVLYPDPGYAKRDLAEYFDEVADVMLPHLSRRPLVLNRFPDGLDGDGFFQKQAPANLPDRTPTVTVPADNQRGEVTHVVAGDRDTLRFLANQACLELHRWLSRSDRLDNPDLLVIDLDPPEAEDLDALRETARATRDLLDELSLAPFLMATGGSGYHVVAPLTGSAPFDRVRELAKGIAERLAAADPDRRTTEQRIANRGDRIFLDVARNAYAQTAVTPYSPRARPGAPVATPLEFGELGRIRPAQHDLASVRRRLARKGDPWSEIDRHARPAETALERLRREDDGR